MSSGFTFVKICTCLHARTIFQLIYFMIALKNWKTIFGRKIPVCDQLRACRATTVKITNCIETFTTYRSFTCVISLAIRTLIDIETFVISLKNLENVYSGKYCVLRFFYIPPGSRNPHDSCIYNFRQRFHMLHPQDSCVFLSDTRLRLHILQWPLFRRFSR